MESYCTTYRSINKAKKYVEERLDFRGRIILEIEVEAVTQLMKKLRFKKRLIELGIGGGAFGFNLASSLANNYDYYIGLDASPAMLSIAKNNLNKYENLKSKVDLILGDASYLPFKRSSFNGVISIRLISHLSSRYKDKVFREVGEILATKGFMIFDYYNSKSLLTFIKGKRKQTDFISLTELKKYINNADLFIQNSTGAFLLGLTIYYKIPKIFIKYLKIFDKFFSQFLF